MNIYTLCIRMKGIFSVLIEVYGRYVVPSFHKRYSQTGLDYFDKVNPLVIIKIIEYDAKPFTIQCL